MERPKLYSLVAMVIQSSLLALTMRYSRTEQIDGVRYVTSTAVLMSEGIKVIICLLIMAFTARKTLLSQLSSIMNTRDVIKSCVPAILYTIQNNLQFVAMSYLDAATFQVTYQLKILTTAVFSVCFLRRQLDVIHWSALILLTAGVAIVQFPRSIDCPNSDGQCESGRGEVKNVLVGGASVLVMCVSSGFAGVYTEKILKSTSGAEGMWAKNVQLAFISTVFSFFYVYINDGKAVMLSGFFQGYDSITWIVIVQQAVLGLVISLVMKFADNILKGFASSIAILITTVVSSLLLHDLQLTCSFLIGATVVMGSALLYSVDRSVDHMSSETII
ncbi:UDP-N-acetylglucosamine transporter-like isoform X2 [Physella acuta]|nr:UDP-N-acetylglucosamine transporter-like isoform X2 [Physella acuta]